MILSHRFGRTREDRFHENVSASRSNAKRYLKTGLGRFTHGSAANIDIIHDVGKSKSFCAATPASGKLSPSPG